MKQKNIFKKLLTLVLLLVASTTGAWAQAFTIDFESTTASYTDWTFTNIVTRQTNSNVPAHGGSYYGGTDGKQSGAITTKNKIETPTNITFYVSKETTNNTASYWKIQVSSNGTNWELVGDAQSAASGITRGQWTEVSRNLSTYSDVYVRVYYEGTSAKRCIDDLTLTYTAVDPTAPSATLDKTSLDFGNVDYGTTKDLTFTVTPANLKSALSITCDNAKYTVSPTSIAQDVTTAQTITVTAKPTALNDNMDGTVTISGGGLASAKTVTLSTTVTDPDANDGSEAKPFTVAEAIANTPASGTSQDYYIKGIVSAFYGSNTDIISDGSTYRYYISDDGTTTNQLLVFKGKGLNNVAFSDADDLLIGDEVTILGGLTTYNSTKEIAANNYITSLNRPVIPTHTATFSVNGVTTSDDYQEGEDIVFPADPNDMCGKVFMGWAANAIDGTTDVAPSFVTEATMGTADVTYYAVFAKRTPGESVTTTDVLTNATTGVGTTTNYSNWSNKTATSDAIYAGNSAGSEGTIQLRSNNNSGIVTTASGGSRIQKVTVDWNTGTADTRTLDIYGKNEAYTSASNLYDNDKKGTKLGSIVIGTSTKLTITGDYTYIGIRSNNGAMYLNSITIDWETGTPATYSAYCTTVPAVIDVTAAGWATTTTPNFPVSFDANAEVYIATTVDANITLEKITDAPANTPIVVNAPSGSYTMTQIASASTDVTNNQLKSKAANDITAVDGDYVLGTWIDGGNTVVGFGKLSAAGIPNMTDDKAFIPATALANAVDFLPFVIGDEESETTSIKAVETAEVSGTVYNLAGQKVSKDYKGIVVVNGKKFVRK